MEKTKHTLVLHINPDIEACFMAHLILAHDCVREAIGVVDAPRLKFIPGGPLRPEDWRGEETLTSEALEAKGYVFLDCGGGRYDQHGRFENALHNTVSSLDLMVADIGLDAMLPHLMPVVVVISENDLSGQDVAPKHDMRKSATPHTPRHLRDMVLGWNLRNKEDPAKVVRLTSHAFGCMERRLDKHAGVVVTLDLCKRGFLHEDLRDGMVDHFLTVHGLGNDAEAEQAAADFDDSCEDALKALEQEWEKGVADYWERTVVKTIHVAKRTEKGVAYDTLTLAFGRSSSTRFGAVTRYGNDGSAQEYRGKPRRSKADITIQFSGDGRFLVSTKGLLLDRVAKAIREEDLKRRGVKLSLNERETLDRSGHLRFQDNNGRMRQALYLAEYRTAFGNGFRANPKAERTPLREEEIVKLVFAALGQV